MKKHTGLTLVNQAFDIVFTRLDELEITEMVSFNLLRNDLRNTFKAFSYIEKDLKTALVKIEELEDLINQYEHQHD